jgi:hypothetical protein
MKNKYKFYKSTIIVLQILANSMKMNSKEFKIMSVVVFCKEICICYVQITKHAQKSYVENFSSSLRMPWSYSKRSSLCGSTCFNLCKTISHFYGETLTYLVILVQQIDSSFSFRRCRSSQKCRIEHASQTPWPAAFKIGLFQAIFTFLYHNFTVFVVTVSFRVIWKRLRTFATIFYREIMINCGARKIASDRYDFHAKNDRLMALPDSVLPIYCFSSWYYFSWTS